MRESAQEIKKKVEKGEQGGRRRSYEFILAGRVMDDLVAFRAPYPIFSLNRFSSPAAIE
jgi:hypothetical protein